MQRRGHRAGPARLTDTTATSSPERFTSILAGVVTRRQPRAEHLRDGRGRQSPRVATDPYHHCTPSATLRLQHRLRPGARLAHEHPQLHERAVVRAAPCLHARVPPPQPRGIHPPRRPRASRQRPLRIPARPAAWDRPPSRWAAPRGRAGRVPEDLALGLQAITPPSGAHRARPRARSAEVPRGVDRPRLAQRAQPLVRASVSARSSQCGALAPPRELALGTSRRPRQARVQAPEQRRAPSPPTRSPFIRHPPPMRGSRPAPAWQTAWRCSRTTRRRAQSLDFAPRRSTKTTRGPQAREALAVAQPHLRRGAALRDAPETRSYGIATRGSTDRCSRLPRAPRPRGAQRATVDAAHGAHGRPLQRRADRLDARVVSPLDGRDQRRLRASSASRSPSHSVSSPSRSHSPTIQRPSRSGIPRAGDARPAAAPAPARSSRAHGVATVATISSARRWRRVSRRASAKPPSTRAAPARAFLRLHPLRSSDRVACLACPRPRAPPRPRRPPSLRDSGLRPRAVRLPERSQRRVGASPPRDRRIRAPGEAAPCATRGRRRAFTAFAAFDPLRDRAGRFVFERRSSAPIAAARGHSRATRQRPVGSDRPRVGTARQGRSALRLRARCHRGPSAHDAHQGRSASACPDCRPALAPPASAPRACARRDSGHRRAHPRAPPLRGFGHRLRRREGRVLRGASTRPILDGPRCRRPRSWDRLRLLDDVIAQRLAARLIAFSAFASIWRMRSREDAHSAPMPPSVLRPHRAPRRPGRPRPACSSPPSSRSPRPRRRHRGRALCAEQHPVDRVVLARHHGQGRSPPRTRRACAAAGSPAPPASSTTGRWTTAALIPGAPGRAALRAHEHDAHDARGDARRATGAPTAHRATRHSGRRETGVPCAAG